MAAEVTGGASLLVFWHLWAVSNLKLREKHLGALVSYGVSRDAVCCCSKIMLFGGSLRVCRPCGAAAAAGHLWVPAEATPSFTGLNVTDHNRKLCRRATGPLLCRQQQVIRTRRSGWDALSISSLAQDRITYKLHCIISRQPQWSQGAPHRLFAP